MRGQNRPTPRTQDKPVVGQRFANRGMNSSRTFSRNMRQGYYANRGHYLEIATKLHKTGQHADKASPS